MTQLSSRTFQPELSLPAGDNAPARSRRLFVIATTLLILFGTIVRVRQYAARTSFWRDEAFVVLNVRQLSLGELTGRLKWDQAAPPLFLWGLHGMRQIGGENELSLRLIALLCSVVSLVVFAVLAGRVSLPMPAAFLAIGLLALGRRLIEYSAQVKQYSGDVFVSTLILLIGIGKPNLLPERRLARAAVFSAIAVWFSHPAAIVFGGVSVVLTLQCFRRGRRQALRALLWNCLFVASFAALYFLSIRRQHTTFLFEYWQESFADWRHPLDVPLWLVRQGYDFLQTPYRGAGSLFALMLLLSIGWVLRQRRWEPWAMCAATLGLLVVAAVMGQYPFSGGRLTLFAMPQLFLLCAAGAAFLWDVIAPRWRLIWWLPPAALLGSGIALGAERLVHPQFQSHIRPAVAYVKAHRTPGQALVLAGVPSKAAPRTAFNGRNLEALCYWPDPSPPLYLSLASTDQIAQRQFWLLAACGPGGLKDLDPVLKPLRSIATERDHFIVQQGGAAYLFERARTGQVSRIASENIRLIRAWRAD